MGYKQDLVAALGEFVGTTLFLLLALGGAKTAQFSRTSSQLDGLQTSLGNQTVMFIALSFGMSLLVTAWVFYRVTGGLFNPAITLALYLIGGLSAFRGVLLVVAQLAGGIAASALVAVLTPFGGSESVITKLGDGVNIGQGLFLEAFLTAILVLTVLLLAAEKHKSTYLAPVGIGLVLLACHLFGVVWTGCGINPARAFGPSVVSTSFEGYHWIYWVGPFIGSIMAVSFYLMLKAFDYTSVVFGQDADHEDAEAKRRVVGSALLRNARGRVIVFHKRRPKSAGSGGSGGNGTLFTAGGGQIVDTNASAVEITQAIRDGHAAIVDLNDADMMERGMLAQPDPTEVSQLSYPSMRPEAQNTGGLQPPGTASSGLANIAIAKAILQEP